MVESGILAEGSLQGLLLGKHFNRCKRLHVVAALSFKILHFKTFLEKYQEEGEENLSPNEITEILENDNYVPMSCAETINILKGFLQQYEEYTKETLNGKHGLTAQYVSMYVWFIEMYQLYEFSIRTSDLDLYIYAAYRMCALFFTFNHQNYARWLTKNLDSLMNIKNTHPGLLTEFQNGALSIRRTEQNFCRSAVDLTLEQTINANAANKLTGITAFTNSIHARQRWSETHTVAQQLLHIYCSHLISPNPVLKINTDQKYLINNCKSFQKKFVTILTRLTKT